MRGETVLGALGAQTVAVAVALIAAGLCRRRPAAVRSAVWHVAIAAFLIAPALPAATRWAGAPGWSVPAPISAAVLEPMPRPVPAPPVVRLDPSPGLVAEPPARAVVRPPSARPPKLSAALGLFVWAAGSLAVAALWSLGLVRAGRLVRAARLPVAPGTIERVSDAGRRLGLRHAPPVRVSPTLRAPLVAGSLRPCLVLPPAFGGEEPGEAAILIHELAHIARRDTLAQASCEIVRALWWWHPFVWIAGEAARRAAEEACDDWAVALTGERETYAQALVSCAERLCRVAGIPAARRGGALVRRVRGLLLKGDVVRMTRLTGTARLAVGALTICAFLAIGLTRVVAQGGEGSREPLRTPKATADQLESGDPILISRQMLRQGRPDAERFAALEPFLSDPDPRVRRRALDACFSFGGAAGSESYRARVLTMAADDPDLAVRQAAQRVWGTLAQICTPEELRSATGNATLPQGLRLIAACEMAKRGDSGAASRAIVDAGLPADSEGRLAYLGYAQRAKVALDEAAAQSVAEALTDPDPSVRSSAARLLGAAGPAARVVEDKLKAAALGDPARDAMVSATVALWQCGAEPAARECIETLSRDPALDRRLAALLTVGRLRDRAGEFLRVVLSALDDPEPRVRRNALWALEQIELTATARERLRSLALSDPDPDCAATAFGALSLHGDTQALRGELLSRLPASAGADRLWLAKVLCYTTPGWDEEGVAGYAVPPQLLSDAAPEIRRIATEWLAEAGQPSAERRAKLVKAMLGDRDETVRAEARRSLERLGVPTPETESPPPDARAAALANARLLATAMLSYAQDYDEYLPGGWWPELVMPYLKSLSMLGSPGAPTQRVGYALNAALAGANTAEIADPANTVLLFEAADADPCPIGGPEMLADWWGDGTVCVAFADGHAERLTLEAARAKVWELTD